MQREREREMCREKECFGERESVENFRWKEGINGKRGKSVEKLKLRGSVLLLIRPTFIVIHTVIRVGEKGS